MLSTRQVAGALAVGISSAGALCGAVDQDGVEGGASSVIVVADADAHGDLVLVCSALIDCTAVAMRPGLNPLTSSVPGTYSMR